MTKTPLHSSGDEIFKCWGCLEINKPSTFLIAIHGKFVAIIQRSNHKLPSTMKNWGVSAGV